MATEPLAKGKIDSYLGWRSDATVTRHAPYAPGAALDAVGMAEMSCRVEDFLGRDDTPHQTTALTTESWDLVRLLEADADWSKLVEMQLAKVRAINALGGPRMMCVWSGTCAHLGRLPRYPQDAAHILDAEATLEAYTRQADEKGKVQCTNALGELEARIFCLSMFSHRWERPSLEAGRAFPDSTDHKKAKALGFYGAAGVCPEFARHQWDYYYWIDFACINQDEYEEKCLGIAMLPAYISCCIELIYFHSSTTDYERRAWTRLERVLGFAYTWSPAFVYMDDEYPDRPLHGERMRELVAGQPGLYHLTHSSTHAAAHAENDSHTLSMTITDPLGVDAHITDARDRAYIEKMCEIVRRTRTLNPAFKGGGELVLGTSTMPVDTLHAELDCERRLVDSHENSIEKHGLAALTL